MAEYYAMMTNRGQAKLAAAIANQQQLEIVSMGVGDANETDPQPDETWTSLINQQYFAPLNQLITKPEDDSVVIAEMVIPEQSGGWWIRELGLFDVDGELIAVAKCPPTYKPILSEGSGRVQGIRMQIIVSNSDAITLKIDPAVVTATRDYVDNSILDIAQLNKDTTGFVDRTSSNLLFDESTRTVTLQSVGTSFDVYYRGKKIRLETLSLQIADVSGGRYIILDHETLELAEGGNSPGFDSLLVAYVVWSKEQQKFIVQGCERHGVERDTTWHKALHFNTGLVVRSGGLPVFTLDDANAVGFGLIGPIKIADEDLEHTIIHSASPSAPFQQPIEGVGQFPVMHLIEPDNYQVLEASEYPFPHGASGIQRNKIDEITSQGTLEDVPNGKFVSMFVMVTHCTEAPVKIIAGRQVFDTANDAQGETLLGYGLNLPEFAAMYQLVYVKDDAITENPGKVKLVQVFEPSRAASSAASGVTANSHKALMDRQEPDQHPIESVTGLQQELADRLKTYKINGKFATKGA